MASLEDVGRSGSLAAVDANVEVSKPGMGSASFQLSGTWTATVTFQALVLEGASPGWTGVDATEVNTGTVAKTATANGLYRLTSAAYRRVRAVVTAYTSGTVVVSALASAGTLGSGGSGGGGGAITSVVPGAGATNLGKAEDAAHTSGDVGVAMLAVRTDTPASRVGATGDYEIPQTNPVGETRVVSAFYVETPTATITRPANVTAYTAGDEMTDTGGAIRTFANCARYNGGGGIITGLIITNSVNATTKMIGELRLYDTTSTPATDNLAFDAADGVNDTCVAVIPFGLASDGLAGTGGNCVYEINGLNELFKCAAADTALYGRVIVKNAYTPPSNSETFKFRLRINQA